MSHRMHIATDNGFINWFLLSWFIVFKYNLFEIVYGFYIEPKWVFYITFAYAPWIMTCSSAVESLILGILHWKHTIQNIFEYCMYSYILITANQRQFMVFHLYRLAIDLYTLTYKIQYFHNHANFRYIMEY